MQGIGKFNEEYNPEAVCYGLVIDKLLTFTELQSINYDDLHCLIDIKEMRKDYANCYDAIKQDEVEARFK